METFVGALLEHSIVGFVAVIAMYLQHKAHLETSRNHKEAAERMHERLMALENEIKRLIEHISSGKK